ncbi:MAG TPA: pilus assembly protein TadG-related protein, partial [Acidimicrobiia bacterium]|nr:pilus assembly protein TadG-related protein [Acidimicrobiia bacterium]
MLVTGSRRRQPPPPRARDNSEHGFILVWFAFMLTALLSVTALAIESNHWAHESRRVQKAADAAALGGSVFMPQNLGNIAYTTARALATENGFTDGVNGVSVTVSPGARSNQLKVVISEPVTNLFGAIAGYPTTTVAKHAVAEYERPVALGSPTNQFGNDPTIVPAPAHGTPTYPDLWANVAGPRSEKNKGDATLANVCSASGAHPDNCSNNNNGPNTDYNAKGYYYTIDVGPAASTPLSVQVFDPAFVNVGDNCGNDTAPSPLAGLQSSHLLLAQGLAANFNAGFPMTRADIINRYDPAATSLFCTGDNAFTATTEGNGVLPWTTYRVLGPDDTPADPTNNPPVAGCPAIDFPGTAGNLDTLLRSTTPIAGAPDTLVKYFRQWY